jgi:hypothetical protein
LQDLTIAPAPERAFAGLVGFPGLDYVSPYSVAGRLYFLTLNVWRTPMNKDFHFHATFYSAMLAGYDLASATTIAHAGEYIDDSDESRLLSPEESGGVVPLATALTVWQTGGHADRNSTLTTIAQDRRMWTAFHFIPGNLDLHMPYQGPGEQGGVSDSFEYGPQQVQEFRSMCLPDSPLAIAMVNDTMQNHRDDLHMIGIRMHALIDTFAHMLFCGSAAWHVNDVDVRTEYQAPGKTDWQRFDVPKYTPQNPYYDSIMYTGHGRMGHIPDYPWIKYRYHPKWSAEPVVKDNPAMYKRAFEEMTQAMRCIRSGQTYAPQQAPLEGKLRDVVDGIIRKAPDHGGPALFYDWTDELCGHWIDSLQAFRKLAKDKEPGTENLNNLPLTEKSYPQYLEDQWVDEARGAGDKSKTNYHAFHKAVRAHLAYVEKALAEADLPILGGYHFATASDIRHMLDRDIRITCADHAGERFWEVVNSSRDDGKPVQLWGGKREQNVFRLSHEGFDRKRNGVDVFSVYNPSLDRYVSFWFDPGKDRIEGFPVTSKPQSPRVEAQAFPIVIHRDGTFRIHINADVAMVREGNNTGNGTKIVAAPTVGLHRPEAAEWRVVDA